MVMVVGTVESVSEMEGVGRFVVEDTIPMDAFAGVVAAGVPGLELEPTDGPKIELAAVAVGDIVFEVLTGMGFARIVTCGVEEEGAGEAVTGLGLGWRRDGTGWGEG